MERRNPGNMASEPVIVPGFSKSTVPEMMEKSNPVGLDGLESLLTYQRLSSYLAATDNDSTSTVELYNWNARANAAALHMVGMVEVLVRNALDRELVTWADNRNAIWFDIVPLDNRGKSAIRLARDRATNSGRHAEIPGKVIAELTFGFWRYLCAQRYLTTLWTPALHKAFPLGPTDITTRRFDVETRLDRLNTVRNRAAHHKPNHRRDLMRDFAAAQDLAGWIAPQAQSWLVQESFLPAIIFEKPK